VEVIILLIFTGLFAWWAMWVSERGETKRPRREPDDPAD
jgi:hypothetical protein